MIPGPTRVEGGRVGLCPFVFVSNAVARPVPGVGVVVDYCKHGARGLLALQCSVSSHTTVLG
jgi:hypothetical protein